MSGEPGKEGGATVGDEHEMAERDREWLDRMADAEDRCVGGPSVGGLAVDLGMLASPSDGIWRCENCGGIVEATDSRARWAGDCWQHACGDPQAGHYDCRFFGGVDQRDAEIARLRRELKAQREGMGREIGRLSRELEEAREEARRYYRADGSFELLGSSEQVIERRKAAAKEMAGQRALLGKCYRWLCRHVTEGLDDHNGATELLDSLPLPEYSCTD